VNHPFLSHRSKYSILHHGLAFSLLPQLYSG
jgi:hypothetical protein